jgi:hypothetical protein
MGYFDPTVPAMRVEKPPADYGDSSVYPALMIGSLTPELETVSYNNFAPRVGLAYQLTPRTVVRTGAGLFFIQHQLNENLTVPANPGVAANLVERNTPGSPFRPADSLFAWPVSNVGPPDLASTLPDWRTPYLFQWNFNLQRQLSTDMVAEVGYAGSSGSHLMDRYEMNQARLNRPGENLPIQSRRSFSGFGSVTQFAGVSSSNYNALISSLTYRPSKGPVWLGNYTWSRSFDTNSSSIDDNLNNHADSSNRRLEYGPSAFDVRHRVSAAAVYDLPFGPGRRYFSASRGWIGVISGGWQFNATGVWQTGGPLSVTWLSDRSVTGGRGIQRPDRIADGNLPRSMRSPERWFDTGAFLANPVGTFGSAGRNILWQDDATSLDLSLIKEISLHEGYHLQFRVESFNSLNSTNFGRPGAEIDGANFGVVTTVGPAREVQLALKLLW